MAIDVGSTVHPWYKGIHEWKVKKVSRLKKPVNYVDPKQEKVEYDPKILLLESLAGKVLWFNYWMSTNKTKGKMKYGGGPPMLEESVLLELLQSAIRQNMVSKQFLKYLKAEIEKKP